MKPQSRKSQQQQSGHVRKESRKNRCQKTMETFAAVKLVKALLTDRHSTGREAADEKARISGVQAQFVWVGMNADNPENKIQKLF